MTFGRSGGLSVPIFLLWRRAKRISTAIPNAKPDECENAVLLNLLASEDLTYKASLKTKKYPSVLVRKTLDSFGEKGGNKANKKAVFSDELNVCF